MCSWGTLSQVKTQVPSLSGTAPYLILILLNNFSIVKTWCVFDGQIPIFATLGVAVFGL